MAADKDDEGWPSLADLLVPAEAGHARAPVGLYGVPLALGAVNPGAWDRAPSVFRATLRRLSTYDIETGLDLRCLRLADWGDADVAALDPVRAHAPARDGFAPLLHHHALAIMLGGHNGVTRAAVHAHGPALAATGLLTIDTHLDMRSTAGGLMNGNPVSALREDGLPGANIAQLGIAAFANTASMHARAVDGGHHIVTLGAWRRAGIEAALAEALDRLAGRVDRIHVDFDIDCIERGHSPGASGGRADGLTPAEFFAAAEMVAVHPKVRSVDLTEFDPGRDVADQTALIAARWLAGVLRGVARR